MAVGPEWPKKILVYIDFAVLIWYNIVIHIMCISNYCHCKIFAGHLDGKSLNEKIKLGKDLSMYGMYVCAIVTEKY